MGGRRSRRARALVKEEEEKEEGGEKGGPIKLGWREMETRRMLLEWLETVEMRT